MLMSAWFGVLATSNYVVGNVWIGTFCAAMQIVFAARWMCKAK